MICSKCGFKLEDDSNFCKQCGNKVTYESNSELFAYVCPKCKTPNSKTSTYCIKCGHWLIDSNFPAKPITEKEYYQLLGSDKNGKKPYKKKNLILPAILYIIFALIFIAVPMDGKVFLSLLIGIYGVVNIIIPIRALLIKKRLTGIFILIIGVVSIMLTSVSYTNNMKNDLSTMSNINIVDYKLKCNEIIYDDLARNTEKYKNVNAKFQGQIIQVQENGQKVVLRVNVTKGEYSIYKDTVWVNYTLRDGEKHFLEKDVINIWGTVKGRKKYTAVLGNEIIVPEIDAIAIELNK